MFLNATTSENVVAQMTPHVQVVPVLILGMDYRLTRSFWIAPLAALLYDYFLTLGEEVTHIWTGRMTWARVLFLMNRYWPIVNLIFDNIFFALVDPTRTTCIAFFNATIYAAVISHFTIGSILIMRIYAMYECNKRLLAALISCFAVEIASEMVIDGYIASKFRPADLPEILPGCIPDHVVSWAWAYWVPMLVFESGLFLLAIFRLLQLGFYKCHKRTSNLLVVLLRDSVMYFGGVLAVILANFVAWKASRQLWSFAPLVGCLFAVHSSLGCRMLINIRKADSYCEGLTQTSQIVSSSAFDFQKSTVGASFSTA